MTARKALHDLVYRDCSSRHKLSSIASCTHTVVKALVEQMKCLCGIALVACARLILGTLVIIACVQPSHTLVAVFPTLDGKVDHHFAHCMEQHTECL